MTIFFLDLETLGLEWDAPIVEIGMLALSDDLQTELGSFERVIHVGSLVWRLAPKQVLDMHEASGLREATRKDRSGVDVREAQIDAHAFLSKHGGEYPVRGWRWGGSGVNHFDSAVLAEQWPEFRSLLFYRADYDVSSPRGFAQLAGQSVPEHNFVAHRALDDCRIAWAEAKWILDLLRPTDVA